MTYMNTCLARILSFWKTWKRRVNNGKNVAADTVDGFVEPHGIAGIFAEKFSKACKPNRAVHDSELKAEFEDRFSKYHMCSDVSIPCMSVELVDKCMKTIKLGKAAGDDGIETEHLIHAHPRLSVLLSILFNCIMVHGKVPIAFGTGVIIPLLKGNTVT